MRTLICLSGLARNVDPFIDSFGRRILGRLPERPDLVAHFGTKGAESIEPLVAQVSHATLRVEDDPELGDVRQFERNAEAQRNGTRGNLLQWHSMKRCAELKAEREAATGLYDLVVWSRADLFFFTDLDEIRSVAPRTLYVPAHDSWGGIMDRFCYGRSDVMDERLRVLDHFTGPFLEERVCADRAPSWNAEKVLRHQVETGLAWDVAYSRVVTGRIRLAERGLEIARPRWRKKYDHDVWLRDESFRRAIRRLRRMRWAKTRDVDGANENRLPLAEVTAELDREPGFLGRRLGW